MTLFHATLVMMLRRRRLGNDLEDGSAFSMLAKHWPFGEEMPKHDRYVTGYEDPVYAEALVGLIYLSLRKVAHDTMAYYPYVGQVETDMLRELIEVVMRIEPALHSTWLLGEHEALASAICARVHEVVTPLYRSTAIGIPAYRLVIRKDA